MITIATMLVYAQLMWAQYDGDQYLPDGWYAVEDISMPLRGLNATLYGNHDTTEVVLAVRGTEPWKVTDLVAIIVRRLWGYRPAVMNKLEDAVAPWNTADLTIIGHSGGGGIAQVLANRLGVPAVTFNTGRPAEAQATTDNDLNAYHVIVTSDRWGDWRLPGTRLGGPLPGLQVYLPAPAHPAAGNLHEMATVVQALRAALTDNTATEERQ